MDVYVLNNAPYARTMKRGRPTTHPSDARRYRLELGVGETAKEAYERWYAVLDGCQDCYNNVDLLNEALDSLLERPVLHYQDGTSSSQADRAHASHLSESVPALMSGGLHDTSEETLSVDMDIEEVDNEGSQMDEHDRLSSNQQVKKHCTVEDTTKAKLMEKLLLQAQPDLLVGSRHNIASTPLHQACTPIVSIFIGSDVSPITDEKSFINTQQTSTPKRSVFSKQGVGQATILDEMTLESNADGSILVDIGETSMAVSDNEETLIQSLVDDYQESPETDRQYSSSDDPYIQLTYGGLSEELKLVNDCKCMAFVSQLLLLLGRKCRVEGCDADIASTCTSVGTECGFAIKLSWECKAHHKNHWYSSPTYAAGFAINHIVHLSILFSGMGFQQFLRFCKFVGLSHTQPNTYYRFQRLYAAPTVNQEYISMESEVVRELNRCDSVIVSGDCRMDSPGFSAVKGTYTLMNHETGGLISMQHGDKRQVNLKSTNLEAHLFKKVVDSLLDQGISITEIVTDANTQIISLMKKTQRYQSIHNSLDVWHKSCKLTKKISEAAKKKKCQDLGPWAPAIRNHFWFVCRKCEGDAELLRELWVSIIHHVCNSHEWATGKCMHDPIQQPTDGKVWIENECPAADCLREIIFDTRWLNSLPFYVKNRHTGGLESFHNLILSYAPKRIGYKHDAYVARVQLAFIDHNKHLNRPQLKTRDGKLVYTRKWGRRTSKWQVVPIPVSKTYSYMPELVAKSMYRDKCGVLTVGVKSAASKTLFPNIASCPALPTEVLLEQHVSRRTMEHAQI